MLKDDAFIHGVRRHGATKAELLPKGRKIGKNVSRLFIAGIIGSVLVYASLKTIEQLVATFDHLFDPIVVTDIAGKDFLHHAVLDITDLGQITQTYTARVLCSVGGKLVDRNLGARGFIIKTRLFGELIAPNRYGNIAGTLVPFC